MRMISGLTRISLLWKFAEGVETAEAWRQVAALGCDIAQGYYLSRAMRAAEVAVWLRAARVGGRSVRSRSA